MSQVQAVRKQQHHEITYLIEETRDLVSPPQVHFALLEVLNDPISTTDDMAEVIAMDPALTARLLRIVNSPYYGLVRRIDTISRAVTVIGSNELFNLAVAVAATAVFSRLPGSLVNMDCFWRHSVFAAMVSRELAKRANVLHPERLFVGGLLHDVGSLLLYNERPDTMSDLLLVAQGDEEVMFHAELHRLGFSTPKSGKASSAFGSFLKRCASPSGPITHPSIPKGLVPRPGSSTWPIIWPIVRSAAVSRPNPGPMENWMRRCSSCWVSVKKI